MKSYEEVTNNLLERRDRYVVEQNRKRKRMMGAATSLCFCCLVAIVGFAVWRCNIGTPTLPHAVGEQVNKVYIPNNTIDAKIWLSADEAIKSVENDSQKMGVAVPMLIAYRGAIYGCFGEVYNENSQYSRLDTEVIFRKNYSYPAYQVKDIPDSVAIVINGRLTSYQKLFEVNAVIDDTTYRVIHPMRFSNEYSYGEIVQENDDFTVYQAINGQSGEVMELEYIINILPLLKRELPSMFDGDENYGDAWWVATSQSND